MNDRDDKKGEQKQPAPEKKADTVKTEEKKPETPKPYRHMTKVM